MNSDNCSYPLIDEKVAKVCVGLVLYNYRVIPAL